MNLFKSDETPFIVDVAQYAGNHRGRVDNLECWEIRDPRQEPFNSILQAVCEEVSRCRSIPRSSHVLIDIFLRGKTLDSSTAYVMLAGTTQRHRKSAVRHLRRGPLLRDYPGLKVDQWDWPPQALNIIMTGKKGEAPDKNLLYRCSKFDIRRLASGNAKDTNHVPNSSLLSIIATNDGEETSRAGTLSCVVTVGQDDFFFAPAHIFMPRPPEEPEEDIDMEDSESDCESEMLRAGSATPSDLSSDSEATTDDIVQDGLSGSWSRAERPNSTQPSHATEGFEIFSPEHDYALIPVPDGETFHQELRCISKETVERIDAGQFAVSVMTPSRGLMNGLLDGRPTLMRLPYSSKFTRFYPISLPDAVSEGDCGSLVIDQNTKQIYGFIVAASIESRVAYIVSADEILQNITAELGKECGRGQPLESMAFANRQLPPSSKYGEPSVRSSAIGHPVVTRVCDPSPNIPVQSAGLPYEACAHGSSERPVASNEAFNSQSIDCDQVMSSHFDQGVPVYSKSLRFDHMNGCRSLDGPAWVSSPFMSPVSPIAGATLPSISSVNKKTELEEFLDTIVDVFPPPSATTSTLAPPTVRVPTELLPPTTYTSFCTLLEEVVTIRKRTFADTHPDRLASQHELARAYHANGQVEKAVQLLEEVVAIRETLADEHPDRLASQHELARAYYANGQVEKAVQLLKEVVAIQETLAAGHPDRLASQQVLAAVYLANGQVEEAVQLLEEVVAIREILVDGHPDRLASQHELARAYYANGQVEEAVQLLEEVVAIRKRTFADTHPDRLASQHELARAYHTNGQVEEAVQLLEEVVAIEERILAAGHPDRLASQHELARAYHANGQVEEAVQPTTKKAKRAWSARRTLSESDECDDDDRDIGTQHDPHKNTAIAPPPRSRPSDDGTGFVYPRSIHDDLRKPDDSDFEDNCEFCPYYLMEPFQFIQQPWNSCLKPRAEFTHIISHAVSDHAFIRGRHPHRHSQRFITKCALHEASAKGKNKCEHCKKPDRWTQDDPDDPADETHFGGALCLRCYSQFPTRADLVNHQKELNICAYREDLPLNEKMKHLYVTFASSTAVPKFHPSATTPRENGVRKRRLKGGQEQASLPAARRQKNGRLPGPARQILSQPASSQTSSPLAASHLSPPQNPSSAPTLVNTEQSDPMLYPPQPHPYGPHPDEPWYPGMKLPSHNLGYPDFSSMPEFSVDPLDPMFPEFSLPYQPVQNAHNWQQHGVQPAGKSQWDQFTDSGFGSMLDEDVFNNMTSRHGT